MTSAITASDSAPPGPPRPSSLPRAVWWLIATVVSIAASLFAASVVEIPYYAIAPGSAVPVTPLVRVVDGPSHPPQGTVYLCTVTLGPTTILQALEGWLDPEVDVIERDRIVPRDTDRARFRELNLQEMDISKETAVGVAFEHLGYDAIVAQGAKITEVLEGEPSDGKLEEGDVVLAVDGTTIDFAASAVRLVRALAPGDPVSLTVRRGDTTKTVEVVLGRRPDDRERAFLGVTFQDTRPEFRFPYQVEIASDQIGGPSAGLAFTLEVLDVLTPGELTGGHKVATTGTIELDGTVEPVGGVAQKTAAVRRAGAELFLVPSSEVELARRHAGSLRVEGVDNLDDALRILASLGGNGLALGRPGAERG